jgi:methionine-rich copper-binding protein CopC
LKRFVLALVLTGLCGPAAAHAFLEKATPSAGASLRVAPAKVALSFSEALEPAFSGVTVTNAAGRDMSAGPAVASGNEMSLPLCVLKPGHYSVRWHAVSVDTHRTDGRYNFTVLP